MLDNKSNEHLGDLDEDFEQELDNDKVHKDQPVIEDNDNKPFSYDHPVLRRIDGIAVFYISAVAETFSSSPNRSSKY